MAEDPFAPDEIFPGNKRNTSIVILCFTSLHGIGLLLVIVNSVFLKCSRGQGSVRIGKRMKDLEIRRCCKIRSTVACNMLIVYHIVLIAAEIITAVALSLCQIPNNLLKNAMWILAGINYIVLLFFCIPCSMVNHSNETQNRIGSILGHNALELFHFLVFWVCAIFMIICIHTNCNYLPFDLKFLGSGAAVIPLIIAYVGMVVGSFCNKYSFTKVTSKYEAVELLKRKLQETPSIEWQISCGHHVPDEREDTTGYVETCRETSVYTFSSTNVRISTSYGEPSSDLFKKRYTKLKIQVVVRPGDSDTQQEMIENRRRLKEQHRGHDVKRNFETVNRKTMNLFVSDKGTTPWIFHPVFYWCFALLGLSLPYRWCLYCSVGHIRFHIKKRVFREEQLPTVPSPSLGEPSTGASAPENEVPPKEHPLQKTPPRTPPPAYEIACPQFKKYRPKRADRMFNE